MLIFFLLLEIHISWTKKLYFQHPFSLNTTMLVLYKDQNKSVTLFIRVKYVFLRNLFIFVTIYWLVIDKNWVFNTNRSNCAGSYKPRKISQNSLSDSYWKIYYLIALFPQIISKASVLLADAFYKSKCPSVCLSMCSLLRYRLNVFLPPLPKVRCPIFLEIQNPWGKVMERSGLRIKKNTNDWCKIATQKSVIFFSENLGWINH